MFCGDGKRKRRKKITFILILKTKGDKGEIIKSVIIKLERQTKRARVRVSKRYES